MQQQYKTFIREIFSSIQGEGTHIGEKHVFVRFCKCNLKCDFCDTDFEIKNAKNYSTEELYNVLKLQDANIISFTGGEPLLDIDFLEEFLKNYKDKLNKKIYLETNGTLYDELARIIDYVDIVAMDIKVKSATNQDNRFIDNEKFLKIASKKENFVKVVFDNNIKDDEIENICNISKKYNSTIILQPKMPLDKDIELINIFNKFYKNYSSIRLIPQVHKFLNLL